jgi:hypothetical protein
MSRKTFNPTVEFYQYIALSYRYMRFICSIKKISMLDAYQRFGNRYKTLYSKKVRFIGGRLQRG